MDVLGVLPEFRVAYVGEDITLFCFSNINPIWFHDSRTVNVSRTWCCPNELRIFHLTPEDGGLYSCRDSNSLHDTDTMARLVVLCKWPRLQCLK